MPIWVFGTKTHEVLKENFVFCVRNLEEECQLGYSETSGIFTV